MTTEEQRRQQVMKDFMNHEGWQIICEQIDKDIEKDIKILTGESIDTIVSERYNQKEFTYHDLIRFKLSVLRDIKKSPKKLGQPNSEVGKMPKI